MPVQDNVARPRYVQPMQFGDPEHGANALSFCASVPHSAGDRVEDPALASRRPCLFILSPKSSLAHIATARPTTRHKHTKSKTDATTTQSHHLRAARTAATIPRASTATRRMSRKEGRRKRDPFDGSLFADFKFCTQAQRFRTHTRAAHISGNSGMSA